MIIAPDLVDPETFPGFRCVTIPLEEAYAADALYVGDGRVITPSGFPKTSVKLREAGYKPVEVEVSEFYKGDGGVTCLCSPIYRLF
jgi:dimethylargininase